MHLGLHLECMTCAEPGWPHRAKQAQTQAHSRGRLTWSVAWRTNQRAWLREQRSLAPGRAQQTK